MVKMWRERSWAEWLLDGVSLANTVLAVSAFIGLFMWFGSDVVMGGVRLGWLLITVAFTVSSFIVAAFGMRYSVYEVVPKCMRRYRVLLITGTVMTITGGLYIFIIKEQPSIPVLLVLMGFLAVLLGLTDRRRSKK